MSTVTAEATYEGLTAEQWRAKAGESSQRSRDSFDRCDTDGFLSQWASDCMAGLYYAKARLAEQGGMIEAVALFDLDGNLVPAIEVEGRYGMSWGLVDPANPTGRFLGFVNESKAATAEKRREALANKGYRLGTVRTEGYADLKGTSKVSVSAATFPRHRRYSAEQALHTVISTDDLARY